MVQTAERIHEGGFMPKSNDWGLYSETSYDKDTFISPVGEAIPDSIRFNELWSVLLLCLFIHFASFLVLVIELITCYTKIHQREIDCSMRQNPVY